MTDPQLTSNNNNNNNNNNTTTSNNNNNNDGEPKYLHKKFKKMATTEASTPMEANQRDTSGTVSEKNTSVVATGTPPPSEISSRKRDHVTTTTTTTAAPSIGSESSRTDVSPESEAAAAEARKTGYVCPYCKLSCAKPSVLQKHIRAHTNERPYPCVPCGFAFKTKSNLYKHCRSRAHALKMEGGDAGKVSEDSDISLSDSASNGTGTPPPPATTQPASSSVKTVKTGKIYKPKFHTGLQCATSNNEADGSSPTSLVSPPASVTLATASSAKPNAEQLQEHIDKIITDNQAIVDAIDPRLHKLVHRQQSLAETRNNSEQPLNLSSIEPEAHEQVESSPSLSSLSVRKRCYSDSFAQETRHELAKNPEGSIIKDLLLKSRVSGIQADETIDNFVCPCCKVACMSPENLEAHRRYYCKSVDASPLRNDFQLDLEKREDYETTVATRNCDYYGAIQPLPSPGPLLGNTRLVDAYAPPPTKKQRSESVPTSLRSLEELSKYPRPNSLQMFGGEVRILDNSGETKTMRIEPRQSGSPPSEHVVPTNNNSGKCATSETSSIVVRSGLHSGGTMVHKPSGASVTPVTNPSPGSSVISLANTSKILAPIIPNISTPSLAPNMSRYSYLEPHLNPLTSITAYNPLTLPQAGIASILHGGKVIPYVPGMPGPHTLNGSLDISTSLSSTPSAASGLENATYKIIPGLPGLHVVAQPLDLASPSRVQTPPGIPGPNSNAEHPLGQPLDLASPAKENKNFGNSPLDSPKHPARLDTSDKYRTSPRSCAIEATKNEPDRQTRNVAGPAKFKRDQDVVRKEFSCEKNKPDNAYAYPNGREVDNAPNCHSKRKRPASWSIAELESPRGYTESSLTRNTDDSTLPIGFAEPRDNERTRNVLDEAKSSLLVENYTNGAKLRIPETGPRIIIAPTSCDNFKTDLPSGSATESGPARAETKRIISDDEATNDEETSTKFLRPTSLPLKPGTFTPKRHHGITPTANTLPLISPETPRPKKSYGQLYLNGHAYTYLGLKCSTRVFYCTVNRPQPMYVTQQHGLSMYSNWKICKETPPDLDMAHYDSRHRPPDYTVAWKKPDDILTHSSQRPNTPTSPDSGLESDTQEKTRRVKIFDGGFESNEDYTYVRGRGRGRYVCEECGIRCKKPSMLKKHIRTHTDVRPYTCKHCTFSFKTKGNLTKHMKSKAHYKKCVELGVVPVPTSVCDENIDKEAIARLVAGGGNAEDTSDDDEEDSEGDESDESGNEEQEAAQSLLSLSQRSSNRLPGLLPTGRPTTYPYALTLPTAACVTQSLVSTLCATSVSVIASTTSSGTMIPSEASNRYYFPSTRDTPALIADERRDSVIRSSRRSDDDSDVEIEETMEATRHHQSVQQPMDLTTRQTSSSSSSSTSSSLSSPGAHRPRATDILTAVSEPVLMQTIVQSMERLPHQGTTSSSKEWKPEADGHMLQAYLTERHVMDSKMKQQYRVGTLTPITTVATSTSSNANNKSDKHPDREIYTRQMEFMNSRNTESSSTPTVTYTNPSRLHQSYLEMRIKSKQHQTNAEEPKLEIRETICQNDNSAAQERRNCETKSLQADNDNCRSSYPAENNEAMRLFSCATSRTNEHRNVAKNCADRTSFNREAGRDVCSDRQPTSFVEANPRVVAQCNVARNETHEPRSMFNAVKTTSEIERSATGNQDYRVASHQEARIASSPRLHENGTSNSRPPSRETRTPCPEYRGANQTGQMSFHEARSSSQEFKLPGQELRPPSRDFKSPCQADVRSSSGQDPLVTLASPSTNNVSVVVVLDHQRRPGVNDVRSPSGRDNMRVMNEQRAQEVSRQSFEAAAAAATMSMHHDANNKIHEIQARMARSPVETRAEIVAADAKRHEIERTKQSINESVKHTVARKMVVGGPGFRSPSPPGTLKPQAEFLQPSSGPAPNYVSVTEDGRSVCGICNKVFSKPSQLRLHINIHYFERPFRCESCAVSFRTKGHLTKHERSVSHHNKVSMTSTFGAATTSNPRPFKCTDCKIAFRIHGHLAKHLRSKMHIMKLECLGKLPFGTYAEMERSGVNLNDIDTTDCDNSLTSLQILAQKLYEKDPSKMGQWDAEMMIPHQGASGGETSSDEGEPIPPPHHHQYHPGVSQQQQQQQQMNHEIEHSRAYHHIAQQQPALLLADEASKVATNASRFVAQQRVDYASRATASLCCDNHENSRGPHELDHQHQLPYKCQICAISVRTVNELQVHRFVEHNNLDSTGNPIIAVASQLNDHPRDRDMNQKLLLVQQRSNDETGSLARDDPGNRKIDDS